MVHTETNPEILYQIKVQGELDQGWQQWFNSQRFVLYQVKGKGSITSLTVPIRDQAALRGILGKLWDLNLTILSLHRLETPDEANMDGKGENDDRI